MTLEDRARALQLALAKGSWNEGFELIAEALREERRAAFERAAEIVQQAPHIFNTAQTRYDVAANVQYKVTLILAEIDEDMAHPEQDDSGLPTAEDVRGILK